MPLDRQKKQRSCCSCIFSLGLLALSLWLLFNISRPTCSIEEFNVFALTKTAPSRRNNSIHYDLKLKNRNFNKGIYYDALNLTFYYKPNLVNVVPIGNANFTPFYQGYGKGTHRVGDIETGGVKWDDTTTVVFRVELATSLRYKYPLWKTKRRRLVVGADLKVNDEGSLVKAKDNKGIKLSSNAMKNEMKRFQVLGMLGILIFFHSW
ncbi:Protein NDR1 [Bienertia sinuspersici]